MSTPLNGSLLKGFAILDLFSEERPTITTTTVVQELHLNTATAHRFLTTLEHVGVLVSYQRGRYCLSPRVQELGVIASQMNGLAELMRPIIDQASHQLSESIMVCRLGRTGPVCIAVAVAPRPIMVNIRAGTTLPLLTTAHGKLWLAHLNPDEVAQKLALLTPANDISHLQDELVEIRRTGLAGNRGENEPDIGALAMPVFDRGGRMIFSISAFGMLSRFDAALIARAKDSLRKAAHAIENVLTHN
ncbi:MAG: IclR family transcriptional regulator [Phyllobacterium sp.]